MEVQPLQHLFATSGQKRSGNSTITAGEERRNPTYFTRCVCYGNGIDVTALVWVSNIVQQRL